MSLLTRTLAGLVTGATVAATAVVLTAAPASAGTATCVGDATAYNDDGSVLLVLPQTTTTISSLRHDAPLKVYAGTAPFDVNVVSNSQIDVDSTNRAYNLGGGRWVNGKSDIAIKVSSQAAHESMRLNIGMTRLVVDQPTNLVATGKFRFTPPATPQVVSFKTPDQNYQAETIFWAENQTTMKTRTTPTCDPAGEDTVLEKNTGAASIRVVSRSTTTAGSIPAQMPSNASATVPVTVAVDAGTVSGRVRLVVDGTDERPLKTLSGGQTSLVLDNLTEGNHTVKVEFVPNDPDLYEASSSAEQVINVRPPAIATTTTLALDKTTVGASEAVVATATVSAASGSASGSVVFAANGVDKATVPLNGTTAQTSISGLTPGAAHDVTARFVPSSPLQYAASTSQVATVVVRAPATPSTTVVAVSKNPASTSDVLTATATVTAPAGTIAGTVQFYVDGVATGGATAVSNGVATRTIGRLSTPGDVVVSGRFTPTNPADFEQSTGSTTVIVTAPGTPTTTALSLSRSTATSADTVVATVAVSRNGGVPAGSVDLTVDGTKVASRALLDGAATVYLPALDEGTRNVRAVFVPTNPDLDQPSQSAIQTVTVSAVTSTTALTLTPDNTSAGFDVVAVATVATSDGTPKGSVDFLVDGAKVTAANVTAAGTATVTLPPLDEGEYDVTATFVPARVQQQKGSTSAPHRLTLTPPVEAVATSTTATLAESTVTVDDNALVRATVTAPGASPRGQVRVHIDGQTVLADVGADGDADVVLPKLPLGSYTFAAEFVPTNAQVFTPSQSVQLSLTVVRAAAATTTSLLLSPATAASGETVTALALVSASRGTPVGQVAFQVDGEPEVLVPLTGMSAEHGFAGLEAGAHVIRARFVPANRLDFRASTAIVETAYVLGTPRVGTATGLSVAPASVHETETATATVTVTAQSGVATGSVEVTVTDGAAFSEVVTGTLTGGIATVVLPTYQSGDFDVTATYVPTAGSLYDASASATRSFQVTAPPLGAELTHTTLTLSPTQATVGDTVRAVAAVTWGGGTPQGVVRFLANSVQVGQPVALVDGTAAIDVPSDVAGSFTVTAQYVPDAATAAAGSTSDFALLRVVKAAPTPTMTVLSLAPAVVDAGGAATVTAKVTADAGSAVGGVVFVVDGSDQPEVPLTGDTATLTLTDLEAGAVQVGARFVPASVDDFGGSTAVDTSLTVTAPVVQHDTTSTLTLARPTAYSDELVSASVVVASDGGIPLGGVVVTVGASTFRAPLVDGRATVSLAALPVGSHQVTAAFEPSAGSGFRPSQAGNRSVTITARPAAAAPARVTTTSISLPTTSGHLGSTIPVIVTVTGATEGSVRVSAGWTSVTAPLVSGRATADLPLQVAGTSTITAVFLPATAAEQSSSATATVTVGKALTEMRRLKATYAAKRSVLTVTGRVEAIGGMAFCTGRLRLVVKADGKKVSSVTAPLDCSGKISRVFRPVPKARKYTIVATYRGSDTTLPSTRTITVRGAR
jgi:hypothetical protein